ncbi:MAG: FecR domain-containing protein [Pseudomonadota bacterium]
MSFVYYVNDMLFFGVMTIADKRDLYDEAVRIFVRLSEDPDDLAFQRQKDAFLNRGEAEREAYRKVQRAWKVSAAKPSRPPYAIIIFFVVAATLSYFALPEARTFLYADHRTGVSSKEVRLASDDMAVLDAGSALTDDTGQTARSVALLRGSAFFDVQSNSRPFVVEVDDLMVEVLGTQFETALIDDEVRVSVLKGRVSVSRNDATWTLEPGDQLIRKPDGRVEVAAVASSTIASWRDGQLIAKDLSFAQIAEIIDRRLPGRIVILDQATARSEITGSFDLTRPDLALEALAVTGSVRVINITPFLYVVTSG